MVGAALAACGGEDRSAVPTRWERIEVEDVELDVPEGWEDERDDTDGFAAAHWVGPPADDGTRIGISLEVACTDDPDDDAVATLDRYLDGPQWRGHEVLGRSVGETRGAVSSARSVSRYVLPVASTGEDAEVTRHTVVAVEDGVVARLLVEGVSDRLPPELAQRVRQGLRFDAATPDREAACRAGRADDTRTGA